MGDVGDREMSEREMFETLVVNQGSPLVMSVVTSMADTMNGDGVGPRAMIGIMTGGASVLVLRDEPGVMVDRDHQWMFTFAADVAALRSIIESLNETIEYIEENSGPKLIVPEAGPEFTAALEAAGAEAATGDGGVGEVDDDGQG